MKRIALAAILVVFSFASSGGCPPVKDMSYLENGAIKVGVDMNMGGTITYIADAGFLDVNLINRHDMGRVIQQSYYSGPQPYGNPNPGWPNWYWNPIGAGDCYGNAAEVVDYHNDGSTLYVKTIPLQWALDNVPGECTFEKWIELDGNVVEVHYKLVNNRSDPTYYGPFLQELPAVYTTDRFYRLFTYTGNAPFTNGPIEEIVNSGPPWAYFNGTEKWAALVQDNGWGIGVYNPTTEIFSAGFNGTPGSGDPEGSSTGYIAPRRNDVIAHNAVYEYDAYFILGDVNVIRAYVYQHRP